MNELENLRKERDKLRAKREEQLRKIKSKRELKESFRARDREKRQLKSEIRREKYRGFYAIGGAISRASSTAVKSGAKYAKKKIVAKPIKRTTSTRRKTSRRKTSRRTVKRTPVKRRTVRRVSRMTNKQRAARALIEEGRESQYRPLNPQNIFA